MHGWLVGPILRGVPCGLLIGKAADRFRGKPAIPWPTGVFEFWSAEPFIPFLCVKSDAFLCELWMTFDLYPVYNFSNSRTFELGGSYVTTLERVLWTGTPIPWPLSLLIQFPLWINQKISTETKPNNFQEPTSIANDSHRRFWKQVATATSARHGPQENEV